MMETQTGNLRVKYKIVNGSVFIISVYNNNITNISKKIQRVTFR